MSTEMTDPDEVASPIGNKLSGNSVEVRYTPGIRISIIAMILCKKESSDLPMAQKYPLKQKWIPAKIQSHTYPRKY